MFKIRSYRPPDVAPDRVAVNWLLFGAALAILFHGTHIPLWLTLTSLSLVACRFVIEQRAWRVPGRIIRFVLFFVITLAVFKHFGTILGRDAGTAFLTVLVGLKILETRSLRDYMFDVFLLYFLTLGAFFFSQSLITGVYAFAIATVITIALIRLTQSTSVSGVEALRMTGGLVMKALPLMLVMYLLFPRIHGSLWMLPQDAFSSSTGLTDEVTPGSINQLLGDDKIAFRVEFQGDVPEPAKRYWRTLVLSDTDGRTWRRSNIDKYGVGVLDVEALGPLTQYTVTHEPSEKRWLPVLDLPAAAPEKMSLKPGYVIINHRPTDLRISYEAASYLDYRINDIDERTRKYNLRTPTRSTDRVEQLLQNWLTDKPDAALLTDRVLRHFREQEFHYTLTPPLLNDNPLDEFLFETRRGYCEHYASTFAHLMRLAGVPARMVVGYQGGEWNESGEYVTVRNSDAHAWNEVWMDERGWVRVDPTAAVAPERIELGLDALRLMDENDIPFGAFDASEIRSLISSGWVKRQWELTKMRWDALNTAWDRWVMAYGPEEQLMFLRSLGFDTPSWLKMVLTLIAAATLLLLLFALLLFLPKRKQDPVIAAYRHFCARLAKIGLVRPVHEGPQQFAQSVVHKRPDLSEPVQAITNLYIDLRYAYSNAGSESKAHSDALSRFKQLINQFRPPGKASTV